MVRKYVKVGIICMLRTGRGKVASKKKSAIKWGGGIEDLLA